MRDKKRKERGEKTVEELLEVDVSMLEVYSQGNVGQQQDKQHQRTLAPA